MKRKNENNLKIDKTLVDPVFKKTGINLDQLFQKVSSWSVLVVYLSLINNSHLNLPSEKDDQATLNEGHGGLFTQLRPRSL